MLLNVQEMERRKVSFAVTFQPGRVDISGMKFRQVGEVRSTGTAELAGGMKEIRVYGHITADLEAECDRCLETAPLSIDRDFELYYRPVSLSPVAPEMEIDESEIEIGYYEGESLDLADVIREQLLLWLPMHWICQEGCKGICPVCGENRNRVQCECHRETVDDRWAALRGYGPSGSE